MYSRNNRLKKMTGLEGPKSASSRIAIITVLLLVSAVTVSSCARPTPPVGPVASEVEQSEPETPLSVITGKLASSEGSPVAVSIGNNQSARPQSGLGQADVVYEVHAEGGITRYLAIFHSQAPEIVGPIRSARPYLALLAKEWGAIFAHCGGDPKDIEPIREWKVADADEFHRGDLFWRDSTRVPPDNLYAAVDNLRKAVSSPLPAPTPRWEFQPSADEPVPGLRIDYGYKYIAEYRYLEEAGEYIRYVTDGANTLQQKDRHSGEPVLVSNIIVQFAPSKVVYSDGGLVIDLIGEGKASYLLGGHLAEGTWKKTAVEEPTMFYDEDGATVRLAPGQTWIQIVPTGTRVEILQGD